MGEDSFHVPTVDPWEPLKELGHSGAVLKVLEQGGHGHSRPAKHPSPVELIRISFNRRALIPIGHSDTLLVEPNSQPRQSAFPILNFRRYRVLGDVSLLGARADLPSNVF